MRLYEPGPLADIISQTSMGEGRLLRILLCLAVLVAIGISTVWEHVRAVRAGYKLHALEVQREKLREERRRLEIRRAREERLEVLEERARRLGMPIPGEALPLEAQGG
jgi:cell division protein FtsL